MSGDTPPSGDSDRLWEGSPDRDDGVAADAAGVPESGSGDPSHSNASVWQKALAYARLLRLSNGPTAVADVWMGYAVASGELRPSWQLGLMTISSLLFYHAGMVLNDAVDAKRDALDRRNRPIYQGYVSRRTAYAISISMMLLGVCATTASIAWIHNPAPVVVGLLLIMMVLLYNSDHKLTQLGPFVMGGCRSLNVMLGAVAAPTWFVGAENGPALSMAVAIGSYVTGITVFARHETGVSKRDQLAVGLIASLSGIAFACFALCLAESRPTTNLPSVLFAMAIVALIATRGMFAAVLQPTPRNIGRGVGIAIQGLVVIDAVLAAIYSGPVAGLAILALLPVTMLLARWIPQT